MSWIIASIPFWIIGTGAFTTGLFGIFRTVRDADLMSDYEFRAATNSILALMAISGILFLLAARIAS